MKKNKKDGPVKKSAKGVVKLAAVAVVAVVLFFGGFFFGGNGEGSGDGLWKEAMNIVDNLFEPTESPDEEKKNSEEETENGKETEDKKDTEDLTDAANKPEQLPKTMIVTIREDKVFVGDKEFTGADDLKAYIEEINSDEREFKLKDENSILATYEWVTEVFKALKVPLLVPAEN